MIPAVGHSVRLRQGAFNFVEGFAVQFVAEEIDFVEPLPSANLTGFGVPHCVYTLRANDGAVQNKV